MSIFDKARVRRRMPMGARLLAVGGVALLGLTACNSSEPTGDVAKAQRLLPTRSRLWRRLLHSILRL